jgi:4-hydroxythreonine-4-phosphate dehydrogenase
MRTPRLALTLGDPAGIGPEIILKALARPSVRRQAEFVVFGDLAWLRRTQVRALKRHPASRLRLSRTGDRGTVRVIDFQNVPATLRVGRSSAAAGRASGAYIASAVDAVLHRFADGLVTAPIHKVSFRQGGWGKKFIGHTEMLAALTGAREVGLMLLHGPLRAVHVTSHVPLKDVPRLLTRSRIAATIRLANEGARALGIARPRIAVCGLNPHAGDGGLMGTEEGRVIAPAVAAARRAKLRVEGPMSPDLVWPFLAAGRFDVAVAMYHDQGQIPVKLSAFDARGGTTTSGGVNVTLGLTIVRTSPAHGTAFDIAGRGVASEASLVEAIEVAVRLVKAR